MQNTIQQIALGRLVAHPDNPNKMSGGTFAKLVRNIERSGRYEPLIVRPFRGRKGKFQIINGHHRLKALEKLGRDKADVIVWDVDDEQTDILLATLNRLKGSDEPAKKIALLKRLTEKTTARQLGKLLPQTPGQIKRLIELKMPRVPVKVKKSDFAKPLYFFVDGRQQEVIQKALAFARRNGQAKQNEKKAPHKGPWGPEAFSGTKAKQNAEALAEIARHFLETAVQGGDVSISPDEE
jgi:ParB/RepB/Spo0J family partition protein